MPGAGQDLPLEHPFAQGTSLMRADAIDCEEMAIDVKDRNARIAEPEHFPAARRYIRQLSDLNPLFHTFQNRITVSFLISWFLK
jgi:hypothetical protein